MMKWWIINYLKSGSHLIVVDRPHPIYSHSRLTALEGSILPPLLFQDVLSWCYLKAAHFLFLAEKVLLKLRWVSGVFPLIIGHSLMENNSSFLVFLENKLGSGYLDTQFLGSFYHWDTLLEDTMYQFGTFLSGMEGTSDEILAYFLWDWADLVIKLLYIPFGRASFYYEASNRFSSLCLIFLHAGF